MWEQSSARRHSLHPPRSRRHGVPGWTMRIRQPVRKPISARRCSKGDWPAISATSPHSPARSMSNGSTITRLQRSLGGPISREAIRLVAILSHLVFVRGTAFVKGKTGNPCVFLLRLSRRVAVSLLTTPDLSSEAVIHLAKGDCWIEIERLLAVNTAKPRWRHSPLQS